MFRFHLVEGEPIELYTRERDEHADNNNVYAAEVCVCLSKVVIESIDDNDCKELAELKQLNWQGVARKGASRRKLWVEIGIDITANHNEDTDYIKIYGQGEDNILKKLKEAINAQGLEFKMMVEIQDFECDDGGTNGVNIVSTEDGVGEMSFDGLKIYGFESVYLRYSKSWDRQLWHPDCGEVFTGKITISCIAYPVQNVDPFSGSGPKSSRILRKMLDEGMNSDAVIVTSDGDEIKCHRFILTGHSEVFEAMFKDASKSNESISGVIRIDDMCSKSVKAFLAHMYLDDVKMAEEDCAVALDLFKASNKYLIPKLQEQMKQLLMGKPDEWFTVEVAMHLYFFAKKLENSVILKKKALGIMKSNYSALNELPTYIQLFKDEPDTGRQLAGELIKLG